MSDNNWPSPDYWCTICDRGAEGCLHTPADIVPVPVEDSKRGRQRTRPREWVLNPNEPFTVPVQYRPDHTMIIPQYTQSIEPGGGKIRSGWMKVTPEGEVTCSGSADIWFLSSDMLRNKQEDSK